MYEALRISLVHSFEMVGVHSIMKDNEHTWWNIKSQWGSKECLVFSLNQVALDDISTALSDGKGSFGSHLTELLNLFDDGTISFSF